MPCAWMMPVVNRQSPGPGLSYSGENPRGRPLLKAVHTSGSLQALRPQQSQLSTTIQGWQGKNAHRPAGGECHNLTEGGDTWASVERGPVSIHRSNSVHGIREEKVQKLPWRVHTDGKQTVYAGTHGELHTAHMETAPRDPCGDAQGLT